MKPSVALALLLASLSMAGQSRPKEATLDQLVEQASLVVVAVADTPSVASRSVDLGPSKRPFTYGIRRFRVLETLRGPQEPSAPRSIETVGADIGTLLHLARNSLSKIFFSYGFSAGKGLLESRDTLILFLAEQNERGEHPFVANDACLPASRKKSIQGLLSN